MRKKPIVPVSQRKEMGRGEGSRWWALFGAAFGPCSYFPKYEDHRTYLNHQKGSSVCQQGLAQEESGIWEAESPCVGVLSRSVVSDSARPHGLRQAPLSVGFSRQEYWSGLPCPPPGNLPDPGIEPRSLTTPALAGEFFTTSATGENVLEKPL